ncbi:30S ribosomal protein S1 [Clostridium folliculivorans]|uniref:30S ribosomal protein S1 n=1 Tax=Clostridium folliculivorans TaxID=2886038 RepID=A0A9W5XYR7_9CLOT|nr:30S ribosomal protein S1 [Clostridium folliculivorans]GKU23374.1 30S ribosomal protein S1 [Clostridium folliculivorans]GKU29491.1 30S ribosomal protein S1 [Clostridium folliculivorans]
MEKDLTKEMSMGAMMDNYDFKRIHSGEVIKGKIINVTKDEVFVNINYFADGIISRSEVTDEADVDLTQLLNVDDEIDVMILSTDDGEGNVVLSKKKADEIKVWDDVKEAFESKKVIEVKVKEQVKGGFIALYKGIRVFIPGSQGAFEWRDNFNQFVNNVVEVAIIEFDEDKKKVVASRRVIETEEREKKKEKVWKSLSVGEKISGKVVRLVKFGAFVDLGGIEGLVHVSDLSWKRINDPSEVVSVGDEVEVFIQEIDQKKNRISLALKDVATNPWTNIKARYKVNDVVQGRVVKFMNFGAFVELEPGVEGLVHIAEISEENIAKPSDALNLNDMVKVKILDIDETNHRISLSVKEASEKSREYLQYNDSAEGASLGELFGDLFKNL